jgi:hypothetical protein
LKMRTGMKKTPTSIRALAGPIALQNSSEIGT